MSGRIYRVCLLVSLMFHGAIFAGLQHMVMRIEPRTPARLELRRGETAFVVYALPPETMPSEPVKLEPVSKATLDERVEMLDETIASTPPEVDGVTLPPSVENHDFMRAAVSPEPESIPPEPTETAQNQAGHVVERTASRAKDAPSRDVPVPTPRTRRIPAGASHGARLTDALKPVYPAAAVRRELEGRVVLHVEVLADGRPGRIRVHESSAHRLLDEAAIDAVRKARFGPALEDGQPVVTWVYLPIEFRLTS